MPELLAGVAPDPVPAVVIGDPGRAAAEVRPGRPTPPYGWPDTAIDAAEVTGLDVRAASRRGLAHQYLGTPRQDAYSVAAAGDTLIVTVCDGVGSLADSHRAAQIVCEQVPALVAGAGGAGDQVDWTAVLTAASEAVAAAGGDMATTVVAAAFRSVPGGHVQVDAVWVGDSPAFLLRDGEWLPLTPVAADEVGDGRTAALPAAAIRPGTWSGQAHRGDAVFLMTDGVGTPLGSGRGEVGRMLAALWAQPPGALDFAAQVGFARRGFDDDRTVVGVWVPPRSSGVDSADRD